MTEERKAPVPPPVVRAVPEEAEIPPEVLEDEAGRHDEVRRRLEASNPALVRALERARRAVERNDQPPSGAMGS